MRFVDTNVLLYAVSTAADEQRKRQVATALLDDRDLVLSAQVLQEFYVQATRATRADRMAFEDAELFVESMTRHRVVPVTAGIVRAAMEMCRRHQLSYWDAAIVAAARVADCDVVLTEDLQHGQDLDGVVVENPFAA